MKLQHKVLEKLGDFLDFRPDEKLLSDGILHIEDVEIRVNQLGREEDAYVVMAAKVTPLFAHNLHTILMLTMSANYCFRGTNGATFSFDPLTEELFLSQRFTPEMVHEMPAHDFGDFILNLYESAKHWQAVIEQICVDGQTGDLPRRTTHALSFGPAAVNLQ